LRIGAGAQIAAQAGVMQDIAQQTKVGGSPAVPMRQFLRQAATLARLARKRSD
jgi:UDP-3-O-[3-hydroxymyristoyl] glucosamine N-acyltransferase